jgi:NDP-sugar pyrophosphorylase family protein
LRIGDFVADWAGKFPAFTELAPWNLSQALSAELSVRVADDGIFIDPTAEVEAGAIIKGPCWIGPGCFIAATAYLRGGVWMESHCTVGPACELKTVMMFAGSKIAHLSFVGDSIVGADVNIEAGAIIANYRNEMADRQIKICYDGSVYHCHTDKFGALVGDGVRIGANAVIAPGALINPGERIERSSLLDQHPDRIGQR